MKKKPAWASGPVWLEARESGEWWPSAQASACGVCGITGQTPDGLSLTPPSGIAYSPWGSGLGRGEGHFTLPSSPQWWCRGWSSTRGGLATSRTAARQALLCPGLEIFPTDRPPPSQVPFSFFPSLWGLFGILIPGLHPEPQPRPVPPCSCLPAPSLPPPTPKVSGPQQDPKET